MKKSAFWRRSWFQAIAGLVFIIMLFRWFEHRQVYHPARDLTASGAELGRPYENVSFQTSDGVELNGWFYPANTNSTRAYKAFLVCHGNAGNIGDRLDLYQTLLDTGAAVWAFDYRGYGKSHGRPGEEGTYLDAQAAYRWLRQKGFDAGGIISYGESLGGAVACEVCLREQTGGLILQSTFTSIPELGAELFPWLPIKLINSIKYDTRRKLPRLKIPVLVMHSRSDGLIGFRHSEANFAAANEPKLFCELDGEHNDPLADRARFMQGIEKLLRLTERSAP